jgi:hypothetical protein
LDEERGALGRRALDGRVDCSSVASSCSPPLRRSSLTQRFVQPLNLFSFNLSSQRPRERGGRRRNVNRLIPGTDPCSTSSAGTDLQAAVPSTRDSHHLARVTDAPARDAGAMAAVRRATPRPLAVRRSRPSLRRQPPPHLHGQLVRRWRCRCGIRSGAQQGVRSGPRAQSQGRGRVQER